MKLCEYLNCFCCAGAGCAAYSAGEKSMVLGGLRADGSKKI